MADHDVAAGRNDAGHVAICICGWRRTSPTFTDEFATSIGRHVAGLDEPTGLDTLAELVEEILNDTCPFCEFATADIDERDVAMNMLDHIGSAHGTFTINRT